MDKLEYEIGVLGAVLIDSSVLLDVSGIVQPDDFEHVSYQEAYQVALDLQTSGQAVDAMTISGEMKRRGIHTPETDRFLVECMNITPTATNATIYAQELRKLSRMRKIHRLLDEAKAHCADPDSLTDMLMDRLYGIERGGRKTRAKALSDVADKFVLWATGEDEREPLVSGYGRLDRVWGGLRAGQLIIVAARPGVGKSAFATELAHKAAKSGVRSAIFSCEMEDLEIMQRLVSAASGVKMDTIVSRGFARNNDDSSKAAARAVRELKELPVLIDDSPVISTHDIRRALQTEPGIGLVLVDYVQLMASTGKSERRDLELGEITRSLKIIAKEFQVPVVLLSQLNRNKDETDEPVLTDLRESGNLEQDANTVIMLWKLEIPEPGDMQKIGVKVAKNRQGKCGTAVMYFDGERMKFMETAEEYVPRKKGRGRTFEVSNRYDPDFPWGGR